MTFIKLPAIEGSISCLTCGAGAHSDLDPDRLIGVGFGSAGYSKDGEILWQGKGIEEEDLPSVKDVEKRASADPDHDWRIYFYAPMYEAEYQRQGDNLWVLVKKGPGFA